MWKSRNRRSRSVQLRELKRLQLRASLERLEDRCLLASITGGNLLVERIGDGSVALTNVASEVAVLEFATTGGPAIQSIRFPTSGTDQVTDSGSATSNGYLNVLNGFVGVPGYNASAGAAGVASTNTKVGTVLGSDGAVASRTLFPTSGRMPFTGNNFRSLIPTSATTFYATGTGSGTPSTGGLWHYNGSSFTQISSTASGQLTNMRNVEIYGNQLYVSSASGSFLGVSSVGSGLPTTSGQSTNLAINTGANSSPYGFVMFDTDANGSLDLAYIADDRNSAGGGLQKWTFNGTVWSQSWSLLVGASSTNLGASGVGIRGLSGSFSSGVATLYATTNETSNNRMISIADTGAIPTSAALLASAGNNYVFRGLDLVPDNTAPQVTSIDDGDLDDEVTLNDTLTYTITFNEPIDINTVTSASFSNAGSANIVVGNISASSPSVLRVQVTPTSTGTLRLRIPGTAVIKDLAGNALAVPLEDDTTLDVISGGETTPPTVVSIADDDSDNLVRVNQKVTYTITFSEDIDSNTVSAEDFANAASSAISIGTITEIAPGVFAVEVSPTSGTELQLMIQGVIEDLSGNRLVVPVFDDEVLTVDAIVPTITNITHNSTGSLFAESPVTYTISFSEDIDGSSVTAIDFSNAGTASISVGSVVESSPGVFSVVITPTTGGTLKLRIPEGAVITDVAGNPLSVPFEDDETITVNPVTSLGPGAIVVLGYNTAGSPNDSIMIMTMVELTGGTRFIVSDNEVAVDGGSSFTDLNEAEATFTVKPGQSIPAGTIISLPWGGNDVSTTSYDWDIPAGIGLGNNNDEIYIYKALSTASATPSAFIYGVAIGTSTSARPAGLTLGTTFIKPSGSAARYKPAGAVYNGVPSQLRSAIGNTSANWESVPPGLPSDWSFSIGPSFTSAVVNGGVAFANSNQRSMITSLSVSFSSPVSLDSGAFRLENIGLFAPSSVFVPQDQLVISPSSGTHSSFTIVFSAAPGAQSPPSNGTVVNGVVQRAGGPLGATNGNSLSDGNYVLRIEPTKVKSEGFALVGDATFGDLATDRFFRMYGDSDGDGDVDGTDAVALRNAQLAYNAAMDWDGNGSVSAGSDITQFSSNRNRRRRAL